MPTDYYSELMEERESTTPPISQAPSAPQTDYATELFSPSTVRRSGTQGEPHIDYRIESPRSASVGDVAIASLAEDPEARALFCQTAWLTVESLSYSRRFGLLPGR